MLPGLWLFQAGLLRRKNALSIAVQLLATVCVLSIIWAIVGYALVFSPSAGGMIGSLRTGVLLLDVSYDDCVPTLAPSVPTGVFALFHCMFACLAPLLMTGAYAERMRLGASLVVSAAWEVLVYYPLAHWVWAPGGWLRALGAHDFAGGITIHVE